MRRHTRFATRALVAVTALTCVAAASAAPTRLRLNGVGPLTLGMSQSAAVKTGWLAHRSLGCELASPRPVVYRFDGPKAPAGLTGFASFSGGRLESISFTAGVSTVFGIRPGISTTGQMARAYRSHGFTVTNVFDPTFQARFVNARRAGRRIAAVATTTVIDTLAVPAVAVCE